MKHTIFLLMLLALAGALIHFRDRLDISILGAIDPREQSRISESKYRDYDRWFGQLESSLIRPAVKDSKYSEPESLTRPGKVLLVVDSKNDHPERRFRSVPFPQASHLMADLPTHLIPDTFDEVETLYVLGYRESRGSGNMKYYSNSSAYEFFPTKDNCLVHVFDAPTQKLDR